MIKQWARKLYSIGLALLLCIVSVHADDSFNPLIKAAINEKDSEVLLQFLSETNAHSTSSVKKVEHKLDKTASDKSKYILPAPPLSKHKPVKSAYTKKIRSHVQETTSAKKITLNFTNIKTRVLLQLFAQFTGLNFLISDQVTSSMSIHLKNVPWPQALTLILRSQGLAERRIGNNVIIGPLSEIQQQEANEFKRKQQLIQLKIQDKILALEGQQKLEEALPLKSKIIKLKFAKAEDVAKALIAGSVLSGRGKISADSRSNSLIIKDTELHLARARKIVIELDHPEKQVAIDARIVRIQRPYEKTLGIRWGVTSISPNHLSGTLEGANTGLTVDNLADIPITQRLNFNARAPTINLNNPASIGIALARLGNFNVDLELSALENEGKLLTISKPRLVTSNLEAATISTGEEIPFQESTSSGATSVSFKNATLSLTVTPRIASSQEVLLEITIQNNRAGRPITLADGSSAIPIITESETSTILVKTGQTIVLGGIYKQDKNKTVLRVPFLGRLPLIGYLFKQTTIRNTRDELLIFIAPKIINTPRDLNKE